MMKKEKSDYAIQAVDHAFDVLEQFLENANELGVTELSNRLNLSKNTIFRLLATLESRNYIEQDKYSAGYRLGSKNIELGLAVVTRMKLHRQSRPVLEALVRDCDETSDIAILKGSHILYLDAFESSHPVRVVPRIGMILPAYCTAAGKVLLAGASDMVQKNYLAVEEFKQNTPNTITDRNEFIKQLGNIAIQGYALEDEELDMEVRGVAAPIRDYTRSVIGALSIFGPTVRFSKARMDDELIPVVKKAAEEISRRLGYYSPTTREQEKHFMQRHLFIGRRRSTNNSEL
jgi:IclR family KDG regulon transcriptional repressor